MQLVMALIAESGDLVYIQLKYDQEIKHLLTIYVLLLRFKAHWLC